MPGPLKSPSLNNAAKALMNKKNQKLRIALDNLYEKYNRGEFIAPDPLQFLAAYPDGADREIVGFICATLAFGAVGQIVKTIEIVLSRLPSPVEFLRNSSEKELALAFKHFRYRFVSGEQLSAFLWAVKSLRERHGSLNAALLAHYAGADATVMPALSGFMHELSSASRTTRNYLMPQPSKGGTCKRLHLYLRWMIRQDTVDPGGWNGIPPSKLIVPLDTHMFRICTQLGFTDCKTANGRRAEEVTAAFRRICPEDPVRYDFTLTRFGIRKDLDIEDLFSEWLS